MLLLGAELLKEVEEAAAAASSATANVVSVNPMEESRTPTNRPLLLPIGHYVTQTGADSRSHLLEQVMSSVPAAQWQAILPPVLKVNIEQHDVFFFFNLKYFKKTKKNKKKKWRNILFEKKRMVRSCDLFL